MFRMFYYAAAFNQDLGWCLSPTVRVVEAFSGSGCSSNSCGVTISDSC